MMRQLNNKHYDTPGGLLGQPTNVSSHPKPPVSKEDETMKQTQDKWVFNFEENQLETTLKKLNAYETYPEFEGGE